MRRVAAVALGSAVVIACAPITAPRTQPVAIATAAETAPEQAHVAPELPARRVGRSEDAGPSRSAQFARTEAYAALAATLASSAAAVPAFEGRLANWPVTGRITSPFGPRWGGFHNGLDIAAARHTPVRAAAAGQVVTVGKPYLSYGDTATIVIVAHARDFATVYVHLSDERLPIVQAGQRVAAGEVIAYNGSTGWSTGPHVHFMTVVSGRAVDPIRHLP